MTAETEFARLSEFAHLLGWGQLRAYHHTVPLEARQTVGLKRIVMYEAVAVENCLLTVNKLAGWKAAVYAIRYRIFSDWHPFQLGRTSKRRFEEAKRLHCWLAR